MSNCLTYKVQKRVATSPLTQYVPEFKSHHPSPGVIKTRSIMISQWWKGCKICDPDSRLFSTHLTWCNAQSKEHQLNMSLTPSPGATVDLHLNFHLSRLPFCNCRISFQGRSLRFLPAVTRCNVCVDLTAFLVRNPSVAMFNISALADTSGGMCPPAGPHTVGVVYLERWNDRKWYSPASNESFSCIQALLPACQVATNHSY